MAEPYERSKVKPTTLSFEGCWVCHFCGALVLEVWWDDHVSWHQTLEIQAGAVIHQSLVRMVQNMEGSGDAVPAADPEG